MQLVEINQKGGNMSFNIVSLDADAIRKLQDITSNYNAVEAALARLEDSREKSLAITHLEQSHMWLSKAVEREQMNRFQTEQRIAASRQQQQQQPPPVRQPQQPQQPQQPVAPIPTMPPPATKDLSPDAAVLAESRVKLDSLMSSIKDLTDTVAIKGFPITKG